MLVVYAIVVGVLAGFAVGGRLDRLADVRLHWAWLAVAGFVAQVVLFSGPVTEAVGDLGPPLYVASTAAVLAVVVRNVRLAGLPIVALGALLNLAAILANGGYMPADAAALAASGHAVGEGYSNSAVLADPNLRPLTDIFATPRELPLANVFSVGDVLIAIGIAIAFALAMRGAGDVRVDP
ncbi:MAG TPA: DUF5317 family protein [Candidatus Limnocylindrales bacterium]